MNQYKFTITLIGYGESPDQAWIDAIEATNLDEEPMPEEYEVDENDY